MKFLLVALFAAVVCSVSAEPLLKELLEKAQDVKNGNAIVEKIKCHVDAITEAVKGTDLEHKWTVVADEVKQLKEKIVQCVKDHKNEPLEAVKCIAQEAKAVRDIIHEFVESLKEDHKEVYQKIKEGIKKC